MISASERPRPEPSEGCEGEADPALDGEPEADGSPDGAAVVGCSTLDGEGAGAEASRAGVTEAAALTGSFGEACSVPAAVECAEVVPGAAPWGWVGRQAVAVATASPAIMRSRIDRAGFTVISFRS